MLSWVVKSCVVRPLVGTGGRRAGGNTYFRNICAGGGGEQTQTNGHAANACAGVRSEAPRRSWEPGQQQYPGAQNQDSRHKLISVHMAQRSWGSYAIEVGSSAIKVDESPFILQKGKGYLCIQPLSS